MVIVLSDWKTSPFGTWILSWEVLKQSEKSSTCQSAMYRLISWKATHPKDEYNHDLQSVLSLLDAMLRAMAVCGHMLSNEWQSFFAKRRQSHQFQKYQPTFTVLSSVFRLSWAWARLPDKFQAQFPWKRKLALMQSKQWYRPRPTAS